MADAAAGAGAAPAAPSPGAVQTALRALLPTLDLDTTTERQIREALASKLGAPMDPHKKLIKAEIDTFLASSVAGGGGGGGDAGDAGDDDDFDPIASTEPFGKRKRAAGATAGKPAKAPRSSEAGAALPGIQLDAQGLKFLSISQFKGQHRVDVRTYYRNKDGGLAPTQKGASLAAPAWAQLAGVLPQLVAAADAGRDDFVAELPNGFRATTSTFGGRLVVGIREFYTDAVSGELKPGKRGINLTPDEARVLADSAAEISRQLPAGAGAAAGAGGAGAGAGPSSSRPAAAAAAAGAAGSGGGGGGGVDSGEVQLGGRKRAAISTFTGTACVDLREMYERDGQLLPGKKGISLRPDQWRALAGAAADISAALAARDTRFRLNIGAKRDVTISSFKGHWYVGVREYYEKDGEMQPGAKGLNMNSDQWQRLADGIPSLNEQLEAS